MSQSLEEKSREKIAKFLLDALKHSMESYHHFIISDDAPDDAKSFSAHHSACKIAIAHIELLLKLAKWADINTNQEKEMPNDALLAAMIAKAQNELDHYTKKNN
jgi:hypothetical protein|tara:strand:+ start:202029 stop:202340 length:312 start_codon:yes stop_codon:yes gene_type:complete